MTQAGVCLRRYTETTLPENRVKVKEEELGGVDQCAAPGLDAPEPERVTAPSGVSGVHHTHTSLIKTESDLGSTHAGDLIKTEGLGGTELGHVTRLFPDQIKTATVDEGYLEAEQIGDSKIKFGDIKSNKLKSESSESLVSGQNTVMNGAGFDLNNQTDPWECGGEPSPNCRKEETPDLLSQHGDLNHHCDGNDENSVTRIVQKSTNCSNGRVKQRKKVTIEHRLNSSTNASLFNSSRKRTVPLNEGEKPFKCPQCGKCLSRKATLKRHLMSHKGEKPHMCSECGKCFLSKSYLRTHLIFHAGEKPYKCTQCGNAYFTKVHLNRHMIIHTGEKPFKCTQCEKCFPAKVKLNEHMRFHTDEKPHKCSQCEKCFKSKMSLRTHLKRHTGEKPFECPHCGKCFNAKDTLKRHLTMHTGEKPYKCTECGKCFSLKSYLCIHLRFHTGEKPYKCTQCGKGFPQTAHLNKHMRIHTGEKTYKCTLCGNAHTTKRGLSTHMRMHRGENTYKCTLCGVAYTRKRSLNTHMRIHRGEKPLEVL